jgi:hypothetical protein
VDIATRPPISDNTNLFRPRQLVSNDSTIPNVYNTLTKSHTMNAFTSVKSAFSWSSQDLKTLANKSPLSELSPRNTISTTHTSAPLPLFITNIRQVSTAMPEACKYNLFKLSYT